MSAFEMEWADDLPKHPKYAGMYGWFYDQLEESPGKWAKYPGAKSSALQFCNRNTGFSCRTYDGNTFMRFDG